MFEDTDITKATASLQAEAEEQHVVKTPEDTEVKANTETPVVETPVVKNPGAMENIFDGSPDRDFINVWTPDVAATDKAKTFSLPESPADTLL